MQVVIKHAFVDLSVGDVVELPDPAARELLRCGYAERYDRAATATPEEKDYQPANKAVKRSRVRRKTK